MPSQLWRIFQGKCVGETVIIKKIWRSDGLTTCLLSKCKSDDDVVSVVQPLWHDGHIQVIVLHFCPTPTATTTAPTPRCCVNTHLAHFQFSSLLNHWLGNYPEGEWVVPVSFVGIYGTQNSFMFNFFFKQQKRRMNIIWRMNSSWRMNIFLKNKHFSFWLTLS